MHEATAISGNKRGSMIILRKWLSNTLKRRNAWHELPFQKSVPTTLPITEIGPVSCSPSMAFSVFFSVDRASR